MKQSLYLAYRYLVFHRFRTLVLITAIGLIIFLPIGLERLITDSEKQMMARADSFPLIIGSKGSSTDLVINAIYFQQQEMDHLPLKFAEELKQTGLGYSIPLLTLFEARNYSMVGTNLDYFDMAGVYPLKMEIVGVLAASGSQDDNTVFILVGLATLLILILIVTLSLRLRKDEIHTMFTMGSSRHKTFKILGLELLILVIIRCSTFNIQKTQNHISLIYNLL